jgi:predicted nucleotidyltransferase
MDRDQVFDQLRRAVLRLMQEHPEVKEAVLFGSIARGEHGSRSDADVLLVLSESPHERFFDRIPDYIDFFLDADVPVDLFPYTEDEVERMRANGNLLIMRARSEGVQIG